MMTRPRPLLLACLLLPLAGCGSMLKTKCATPADYAAAVTGQDRHGRYEGGAAFLRIDGSAERVEQAFGEAGLTLVHDALLGSLPQPATWPGWGL